MNLQNPFSIILFTISVVMFLVGWRYIKKPPKYSEDYKGFTKSKYEARSKEHWDFSHQYGGKLYLKWACVFLIFGTLGLFINFGVKLGFILGISIVGIVVTVIRIKIEDKLIDKFGK